MKTPVVAALGIAVAAGLAIWYFQPDPAPEVLAKPAIDELRARYAKLGRAEGKDWTLGATTLLQRSDDRFVARLDVQGFERRRYYFELRRGSGGWSVSRDLDLEFEKFLQTEEPKIKDRLGRTLAERFQASAQYRVVEAQLRLDDDAQGITGVVDWIYQERAGRGRYLEEFRLEGDAWTSMGAGRQYDLPGR